MSEIINHILVDLGQLRVSRGEDRHPEGERDWNKA
jgi:hypothetical protein